jgi:pimeloyl-ACP methyl ester carboxylesterase
MKIVGRFLKPALVSLAFISLVYSCKKDKGENYKYLISNDFVVSYSSAAINNLVDAAAGAYPEIADLKPYFSNDVDIYKVTYKTTVSGKIINASGLVCVPPVQGEYPVICFQNGTNTVNAYAPSEYVLNPVYQLVEIVASMGYIVVIPDYPGFGESADIPHPYLIAEPTVRSVVDMLYSVKEISPDKLSGASIKDQLYLIGYSQGGWATLAVHKAIEQDYSADFNLKGSVCGAGPYDLTLLFHEMTSVTSYPMPVYIGYIVNAYSVYDQFTNKVSDILNEPYASRLSTLYTGTLTSDEINNQLTTSISDLFTPDFLSGFESDVKFSSVRHALEVNSVSAWNTSVPLFLIHGGADTSVNPLSTENMYTAMIEAGTSSQTCKIEIIPGLDHGDAVVPAMVKGLLFIKNLQ